MRPATCIYLKGSGSETLRLSVLPSRTTHSNGGGTALSQEPWGRSLNTVLSQPSHEPLPSQVPEPIGAGSSISLPVGDWVTVARYEEGKGGPL